MPAVHFPLTAKNQHEILPRLFSEIMPRLPKFLTRETNLQYENEYRGQSFYDHLYPFKGEIITLPSGEKGIYTKAFLPERIKEIIIASNYPEFDKLKSQIECNIKQEFSNGEFNHIKIIRSKY
jgi:hypothetical protein